MRVDLTARKTMSIYPPTVSVISNPQWSVRRWSYHFSYFKYLTLRVAFLPHFATTYSFLLSVFCRIQQNLPDIRATAENTHNPLYSRHSQCAIYPRFKMRLVEYKKESVSSPTSLLDKHTGALPQRMSWRSIFRVFLCLLNSGYVRLWCVGEMRHYGKADDCS